MRIGITSASSRLASCLFSGHRLRREFVKCNAQQQTGNTAQDETDPDEILNKFGRGGRPVCARYHPEDESNHPIDQNPNRMSILAQQREEHDLDNPFNDENQAYQECEKDDSEQWVGQQADRRDHVGHRNGCMPTAASSWIPNTR